MEINYFFLRIYESNINFIGIVSMLDELALIYILIYRCANTFS